MIVESISKTSESFTSVDKSLERPENLSMAAVAQAHRDKAESAPMKMENEDVQALIDSLEQNLKIMHEVDLKFAVHEASGKMMVVVTNEQTGEVVREIPSSEILDLAAKFQEMVGIIFDQRG